MWDVSRLFVDSWSVDVNPFTSCLLWCDGLRTSKTCNLAGLRQSHEKSKDHQAALSMGPVGPEVSKPLKVCEGLMLWTTDGRSTKLGSMYDRVLDWCILGCPAVKKSDLATFTVDVWCCLANFSFAKRGPSKKACGISCIQN